MAQFKLDAECLKHLSAVISEGALFSPQFLTRNHDTLMATLFMISCSLKKSPSGSNPQWSDVLLNGQSQFPEFGRSRDELTKAISLDHDVQYHKFENRDIEKTRLVNGRILKSMTLAASRRYTGRLYSELSPTVIERLASGAISNLLIISALHGPTSPVDLIPYYDLTMKDSVDGQLLQKRWTTIIREAGDTRLGDFVKKFNLTIAPVGQAYKETASVIASQAKIPFRHIPLNDFGGSVRTGKLLNQIFTFQEGAADVQ